MAAAPFLNDVLISSKTIGHVNSSFSLGNALITCLQPHWTCIDNETYENMGMPDYNLTRVSPKFRWRSRMTEQQKSI